MKLHKFISASLPYRPFFVRNQIRTVGAGIDFGNTFGDLIGGGALGSIINTGVNIGEGYLNYELGLTDQSSVVRNNATGGTTQTTTTSQQVQPANNNNMLMYAAIAVVAILALKK